MNGENARKKQSQAEDVGSLQNYFFLMMDSLHGPVSATARPID
jgi:hypothetical protein